MLSSISFMKIIIQNVHEIYFLFKSLEEEFCSKIELLKKNCNNGGYGSFYLIFYGKYKE